MLSRQPEHDVVAEAETTGQISQQAIDVVYDWFEEYGFSPDAPPSRLAVEELLHSLRLAGVPDISDQ